MIAHVLEAILVISKQVNDHSSLAILLTVHPNMTFTFFSNATFAAHIQPVIHYELPMFALVLACSPSGVCAPADIA